MYTNTRCEGMMREPDSSWCYPLTRQEREKKEIPSECNKFNLYCEDIQTLEQAVKIGCGIISPESIQKLSGQAPGLLDLSDPA